MSRRTVDKVGASLLLDAVKEAGTHLSRLKIETPDNMRGTQRTVLELYSRVRRLRDYLRRCASSFPREVQLDLSDEDANLLVSCLTYDMIQARRRAARERLSAQEKTWLDETLRVRADLAVEFAVEGVEQLPGVYERGTDADSMVRDVMARIRKKLIDAQKQSEPSVPGRPIERQPVEQQRTFVQGNFPPDAIPSPQQHYEQPEPRTTRPQPHAQTEPQPYTQPKQDLEQFTLDVRILRDPRLRTMFGLDQRAYLRARECADFRTAAMHLSSMLEGVLLDHALPRSTELGLAGGPANWDIAALSIRALGEAEREGDRGLVHMLLSTRSFVAPAQQLSRPVAVTQAILEEFERLFRSVLTALGYMGHTSIVTSQPNRSPFDDPPSASMGATGEPFGA